MFLIISHLIRNALSTIKKGIRVTQKNTLLAAGFASFILVASGLWAAHSMYLRTTGKEPSKANVANTGSVSDGSAQRVADKQTTDKQNVADTSTDTSNPTTSTDASNQSTTKSSGTSTADVSAATNSTGSESFVTKITRTSQVSIGTLIAYDQTKDARTYYGGDLSLNPGTITISKSDASQHSRNITIATPDGKTVGVPTKQSDSTSQYFNIAMDATKAKTSGSSFDMFIDPVQASKIPTGVYQLHVMANRTQQNGDSWQYDAFITINVVD